jgi:hypothetical protein
MTKLGKITLGVGAVLQSVVFFGVLFGLIWLYHNNSPVDLGKVYSVSKANGKSEVESIIGKPERIGKRDDTGRESWTYQSPLSWYDFRVDFDADGTLLGCAFQD